jgi:phosphoribosylformimino-5-aminoimidazole carboxamide ribotide isomerase
VVIVPSVDVRGGRVAYRGGAGAELDPGELAARYVSEGADELHLVDLDGAERGVTANFVLLSAIASGATVPCRLAGGIASLGQARAARDAGFAGVLFSSAVFGDEALLRGCTQEPGAIIEIESRDGKLAPRGGSHDLVLLANGMDSALAARTAALRGARQLYVIDLTTDGRLGGPPIVLLEQLRREAGSNVLIHTGGGVRDLNDVRALAEWGAASVVIGRAFLEGRFTIAEAKAACA